MKFDLTLYFITDSTNMEEAVFLRKVEEACQGGVTILQLREKIKTTKEYYELAKKVKQITDQYKIPLIIDDRVDIALAIDAAGVHVGAEDMPVAIARSLLGPDKLVGATAKTVEVATQAQQDGADYVGVGAIYPTTTKVKTVQTSIETLREIVQHIQIPVGAIGGLNIDNIDILKDTGIQGACVVSAIMKAEHPKEAATALKNKIQQLIK